MVDNEVGTRDGDRGTGAVFSGRHDRRKVTDWVYEEVRAGDHRAAAAARGAAARGDDRRAARREQDARPRGARPPRAGRARRDDLVQGRGRERLLADATCRRSTSSASSLEGAAARARGRRGVRGDASPGWRASSSESRELRDAGDLEGLAALLGAFDLLDLRAGHERADPRADREPPGAPDADRASSPRSIPGRVKASVEEHAAIVDAIAARDADEAERADARAHPRACWPTSWRPRRRGRDAEEVGLTRDAGI